MNDKNHYGLVPRLPQAGKKYSGIAAVILTLLIPGMAIAEPELENKLVLDSQPLNVNTAPVIEAAPVTQEAKLTIVLESEVVSPAPVTLATEQADYSETGVATEQGIIDAVSPLSVVDGESPQMPFALLLALLALIAVVPMSRRH